ncbi:hypothetical protein CBS101457_001626 [Exobasidium rhododendri]|nr:hypothetical protein CBS101457_001626 [Exobasidium rhododendri]
MTSQTAKIVELPPDDVPLVKLQKSTRERKRATVLPNDEKKVAHDSTSSWFRVFFKWSLFTILLAFGAAQFIAGDLLWGYRGKYVKKQTYFPPTQRVFTPEELWQYNGVEEGKPVYLSILGKVYDVTSGRWIYGPRGSYSFFAGRDASRAYVTGCFETHLTHDVRGLSIQELQQIAMWKTFFDDHPRYFQIGTLDLPTIDPNSPIPPPCNNNAESTDPSAVISS